MLFGPLVGAAVLVALPALAVACEPAGVEAPTGLEAAGRLPLPGAVEFGFVAPVALFSFPDHAEG